MRNCWLMSLFSCFRIFIYSSNFPISQPVTPCTPFTSRFSGLTSSTFPSSSCRASFSWSRAPANRRSYSMRSWSLLKFMVAAFLGDSVIAFCIFSLFFSKVKEFSVFFCEERGFAVDVHLSLQLFPSNNFNFLLASQLLLSTDLHSDILASKPF